MAGTAAATALPRRNGPRGAGARPAPAPAPPAPASPAPALDGADLDRQVRDALRHLYDHVYLQTHPLTRLAPSAAPGGPEATAGAALRRCLLETIEALQPPQSGRDQGRGAAGGRPGEGCGEGPALRGAWRRYRLLVLRYVEGMDVLGVCDRLAISRREYERQHRLGLDAILSLLSRRWGVGGGEGGDQPAGRVGAGPEEAPGAWSPPPAEAPGEVWRRLPRPLTSMIGREAEIAAVTRLLRRARLLTLTGPAGVGKTRLSLEVATRLRADYPDGVVFVPLAGVAEPGQVPAAIARAAGEERVGAASLTSSLGAALGSKRLLLLLDNFEHLVGAAPGVLDLLAAGPGLTLLVTSRAALGVSGEQEYPVPPLAVPPPALTPTGPAALRQVQTVEAVRLFVARARAVCPSFALSPETAPAVAALCRRLDGLPLAIELAAARVRLFSPPALLARIEATAGALPLLSGGPSDAPSRHRTLRAAIAWSYDLLTPPEQVLLQRLSVFAGGFSLSAAEAVGAGAIEGEGEGGGVVEALDGLASLVAKSLVQPADSERGEPRYRLLETVREFAALRLEESGEADAVRERHTACYTPLAARTQTYDAQWLNDVEREHDNLRAAMRWCLARGGPVYSRQGLRLGAALAHYWVFRGHLSQGQRELAWALARPAPVGAGGAYHWARATLLTKAGHLARRQGDFPTARRLYEAGLALRRETGQRAMLPFSLRSLGALALDQGDFPTARACHGEALALRREAGSPHLCETLLDVGRLAQEDGDGDGARRLLQEGLDLAQANALPHAIAAGHDELGRLAWWGGDQRRARSHHEAALSVARELGDKGQTAAALDHLGLVALSLEDGAAAARRHGAALTLAWEFGDQLRVACCLEGLAAVAAALGQGRRAARLLGAAAARREALGAPLPPSQRPWHLRHLERVRTSLSDEDFGGAWRAGQAMPLERVVAFALAN